MIQCKKILLIKKFSLNNVEVAKSKKIKFYRILMKK